MARIISAGIGTDLGLTEIEIIRLLKRAGRIIQDNVELRRIDGFIEPLLKKREFVPLFNRRNLSGWKGLVGDSKSRAVMTREEIREAQVKADETMRAH